MQMISTNFHRVPDFGKLQKLLGLSKVSWVGNMFISTLIGPKKVLFQSMIAMLTTET